MKSIALPCTCYAIDEHLPRASKHPASRLRMPCYSHSQLQEGVRHPCAAGSESSCAAGAQALHLHRDPSASIPPTRESTHEASRRRNVPSDLRSRWPDLPSRRRMKPRTWTHLPAGHPVVLKPGRGLASGQGGRCRLGRIDCRRLLRLGVRCFRPARDWDRFRSLFHPQARLIPARPTGDGAQERSF